LNKNVNPKRVLEFENLLYKVEQLRNKIKNIKPTGDRAFDELVQKFKQNPITVTDFNNMFDIRTVDKNVFLNLAKFINDIFKTIYTGKYKKGKLITYLNSITKIYEDESTGVRTQFEKQGQDRTKFKNNLLLFLDDAISLYQYMVTDRKRKGMYNVQKGTSQPKSNVTAAPKRKTAPRAPKQQTATTAPTQDVTSNKVKSNDYGVPDEVPADMRENNKLMEELNRIKKIMLS
jgi:hypothetical protein